MAKTTEDLHGSAPDKSKAALLLIDVINDFDFPEADSLLRFAEPMAERLAELCERARLARLPIVYVNDNFGRWRSDFRAQVQHCLESNARGRKIVEQLRPKESDYFVLKPKHSGFFSTTLDTLLAYLKVENVILTGVAANICVLFTANDAYMRDLKIIVPEDCVASNTKELNNYAIKQIETVLKADVLRSQDLSQATLASLVSSGQLTGV
jgi:nicotinamidase-related amidase